MRLTLWTAPKAPVRYAGRCVDKDGIAKDGIAKDGVAKLYRDCTD